MEISTLEMGGTGCSAPPSTLRFSFLGLGSSLQGVRTRSPCLPQMHLGIWGMPVSYARDQTGNGTQPSYRSKRTGLVLSSLRDVTP